jgi:hypothetical protein
LPFRAVVICYCCWAGNCRFWIYRKHRSKYEKLFEADNVQAFAFLPARSNLPFLFLWTRNSAVRFSARVLEFHGMEYHDSDGWIEQYQYEDEEGDFSVHDLPASSENPSPRSLPPERGPPGGDLNITRFDHFLLGMPFVCERPATASLSLQSSAGISSIRSRPPASGTLPPIRRMSLPVSRLFAHRYTRGSAALLPFPAS